MGSRMFIIYFYGSKRLGLYFSLLFAWKGIIMTPPPILISSQLFTCLCTHHYFTEYIYKTKLNDNEGKNSYLEDVEDAAAVKQE